MMSKNDKNVASQRLSLRAKRGNPANRKAFMLGKSGLPRRLRLLAMTIESSRR
jgi:hypothetical protein